MHGMNRLELDLDVYQGPFDLLFTLILKEEVDICEVPLVDVILAYVEHIIRREEADWESLTEFLVLFTALLELKSRALLPAFHPAEGELDPELAREVLVERLLAYRKFKAAAAALEIRLGGEYGRLLRPESRAGARARVPAARLAGSKKPEILRDRLEALLRARSGPDTSHLARIKVDLPRQVALLRRLLRERSRLSFEETFAGQDPLVQAMGILAIIDLLHKGEVDVEQTDCFSDITVLAREARRIA